MQHHRQTGPDAGVKGLKTFLCLPGRVGSNQGRVDLGQWTSTLVPKTAQLNQYCSSANHIFHYVLNSDDCFPFKHVSFFACYRSHKQLNQCRFLHSFSVVKAACLVFVVP